MDQILFLDKPKGLSSYDVIRTLKSRFPGVKIGHAGTLDPLASGLLIVAIGGATKRLTDFLKLPKRYCVEAVLGKISATYDAEGPFEEVPSLPVDRDTIERVIQEKFLGSLLQVPPRFSAVHVGGRRAYDLARQGESFELAPRPVMIECCKVFLYEWPQLILDVRCSSGTYIRSLVHDLGQQLGCGAYVSALRRIEIGSYSLHQAQTLEQFFATSFLATP